MKYYMAPLEGITTYVYRNAWAECFGGMDKYFTPFITPHTNRSFDAREKKDIEPLNNQGLFVVPQILTNKAEDFISVAKDLQKLGYEEVNLNLGCPSGTVVAKKKGSGFLAMPKELDEFLAQVFEKLDMKISVKTRVGKEQPEEFEQLLEIFNRYPLEELIVHPRVQQDFYKNEPRMESFRLAAAKSKNPLCYNGDIFSVEDYQRLTQEFDSLQAVMLGRGVLRNPALLVQIKEPEKEENRKELLRQFHDRVYQEYQSWNMGDKNVLFKMKELWFYMAESFKDSGKTLKKIKKSASCLEYELAVREMFRL